MKRKCKKRKRRNKNLLKKKKERKKKKRTRKLDPATRVPYPPPFPLEIKYPVILFRFRVSNLKKKVLKKSSCKNKKWVENGSTGGALERGENKMAAYANGNTKWRPNEMKLEK